MAEFYRVKVRCVGDHANTVVNEKRTFIVEAENSEHARRLATQYAENSARFGPAWREFQWLESHTVTLPFEIVI